MKAMQVVLSDGKEITVHEPRTSDMPLFFRAMSAMKVLGEAMSAMSPRADGVQLPLPDFPDDALDKLYPLLASLADLTIEEVKALPFYDGLSIFVVMSDLLPENFTKPRINS